MNCTENENRIIQLFEKELSAVQEKELMQHIASCETCKKTFHEYAILYENFNEAVQFHPDEKLKENVFRFIHEESEQILKHQDKSDVIRFEFTKSTVFSVLRYAAILAIGLFIGTMFKTNNEKENMAKLQEEISATKNMVVLAMLQNESSSSRMQAVSYTSNMESNNEVIQALLHTFQADNNVSVRLAALNALCKFKNQPGVHQAFIQALNRESDPRIQLRLIDIMVEMKEEKAVPELYKMLQENNLNEFVKYKAEEGIGTIL